VFAGIKVMIGPSLHAIKNQGAQEGFSPEYLAQVVGVAQQLHTNNIPLVFSLMHLAHLTGTSWSDLRNVVRRESHNDYRIFSIQKQSGGRRRICAPRPSLKVVQRWIHDNVLCSSGALALMHPAAKAYAPGSRIWDNANAHSGASWLIKLDIRDFFESISERQVFHVFRKFGYPELLSLEFARICTRVVPPRANGTKRHREKLWRWTNTCSGGSLTYSPQRLLGHLPQGAPTSAMLANLVVMDLDKAISAIAVESGATYTRYADDIVLSLAEGTRQKSSAILRALADVVSHAGYRVNREKSCVRGPGSRKVVTGLVINDAVPRLPRASKDHIRLCLYHIRQHGLISHAARQRSSSPLGYLNHLLGLIFFARSIEPEFGRWALRELRDTTAAHGDLIKVLRDLSPHSTSDAHYKYSGSFL
jgi:RNA-directed DNA polymerase